MPMITVATLTRVGRLCRELRCLYVRGAFQLPLLAKSTVRMETTIVVLGNDTSSAVTSAFTILRWATPATNFPDDRPPPPPDCCADTDTLTPLLTTASTGAAAANAECNVHESLFPELRSLVLESTSPGCEGIHRDVSAAAILDANGEDDVARIERELLARVNEAAAQRALAHIQHLAPRLKALRLLYDNEVDVNHFINKLWRQMHAELTAPCGPHTNCQHS